jgi:hypothetical protein
MAEYKLDGVKESLRVEIGAPAEDISQRPAARFSVERSLNIIFFRCKPQEIQGAVNVPKVGLAFSGIFNLYLWTCICEMADFSSNIYTLWENLKPFSIPRL